ncbi:MAG: hypothetical protein SGARI_001070, partial [Bacillariaceae sp.]
MRFETLILALVASMMAIAPSEAVRGSHNQMATSRRGLQDAATEAVDGLPAPKEDKADKVGKEDKAEKEDKVAKEKTSKKNKKACKKAGKDKKKRRGLQEDAVDTEVFEGDVDDLEYCSQGQMSAAQCANLDAVPADGKVVSLLKLHLVHPNEKEPDEITEEAEGILDSGDTELRFVGCKDMDAPPLPPKKGDAKKKGAVPGQEDGSVRRQRRARSNRRRKLQTEDHE